MTDYDGDGLVYKGPNTALWECDDIGNIDACEYNGVPASCVYHFSWNDCNGVFGLTKFAGSGQKTKCTIVCGSKSPFKSFVRPTNSNAAYSEIDVSDKIYDSQEYMCFCTVQKLCCTWDALGYDPVGKDVTCLANACCMDWQ